ncbi:MAG: ATP synthase F1 subunit delta [Acidobacteriota bacterium]
MENRSTARKYARVLIKMAASNAELDRLESELQSARMVMESSAKTRKFFLTPMGGKKRKIAAIGEICRLAKLSVPVERFLYILVENDRLSLLGDIVRALRELRDERNNLATVEVTSAQELNADFRESIEKIFSSITGKNARLDAKVDTSLIGGIVARVGSTVYDGAIKGQLMRMKRKLLGE